MYAAFGADCEHWPWEGWIAGVTETGTLQTMWTTVATGTDASPDGGAGIWMSGGGLVSDGPGQSRLPLSRNSVLSSVGSYSSPLLPFNLWGYPLYSTYILSQHILSSIPALIL